MHAVADGYEQWSSGRRGQIAGNEKVDHGLIREPEPACSHDVGETGLVPIRDAIVARTAADVVQEAITG